MAISDISEHGACPSASDGSMWKDCFGIDGKCLIRRYEDGLVAMRAQLAASEAARAALVEALAGMLESYDLIMGSELAFSGIARDMVRGVFIGETERARALLARADGGGGENPRKSHVVEDWSEVPDFATEAEEQAYWQTHSFGEGILNQMTREDERGRRRV